MLLRLLLLLSVLWEGEWTKGRGDPTRGMPESSRLSFFLSPGPLAQNRRYQLELQESVTVQEGLCVLVPCKFFYPSISSRFLYLFWFQKGVDVNSDSLVATNKPNQKLQERTRSRFLLPEDTQTNNCSLTIRDVNMRDSGTYYFQMEKFSTRHSYLDNMLSLKVTGMVGAQGKTPGCGVPKIEK